MAEPGLALAAGLRLERDAAQGEHRLLLESGQAVQLNAYAASILALCDGRRGAEEVVAEALRASAGSGDDRDAVLEFLAAARALRWLVPAVPC